MGGVSGKAISEMWVTIKQRWDERMTETRDPRARIEELIALGERIVVNIVVKGAESLGNILSSLLPDRRRESPTW